MSENLQRIYAVSMLAVKGGDVMHSPGVVVARSKEEAIGIAWEHCRKDFSSTNGWGYHDVVVAEVPVTRLEFATAILALVNKKIDEDVAS